MSATEMNNYPEGKLSTKVDPQALLTTLTTEHVTLQSARSATISESTARAALYVGALSSALIALGFISQAGGFGSAFHVFAMIVLPTLYVLGIFTFVRLVQSAEEDLLYGRAINRIRHYYLDLAQGQARWFSMSGHDDSTGVLANMGIAKPSRWQAFFSMAAMVAFLNAVVGSSAVAFLVSILGGSLALAGVIGFAAGCLSVYLSFRWYFRYNNQTWDWVKPLFPSEPGKE
jgi:hypothetical protein